MRLKYLAVTAAILFTAGRAAADDAPAEPEYEVPQHLHLDVPTKVCLPDLSGCLDLTEGHYIREDAFTMLDVEMKRLQDQETRLQAENKSLRSSASEFPWLPVALGAAGGLFLGVYIGHKL